MAHVLTLNLNMITHLSIFIPLSLAVVITIYAGIYYLSKRTLLALYTEKYTSLSASDKHATLHEIASTFAVIAIFSACTIGVFSLYNGVETYALISY